MPDEGSNWDWDSEENREAFVRMAADMELLLNEFNDCHDREAGSPMWHIKFSEYMRLGIHALEFMRAHTVYS